MVILDFPQEANISRENTAKNCQMLLNC